MIAPLLQKLLQRQDLGFEEMQGAMDALMEGRFTGAQIGGFLIALRMKGETPEEIAAAASILRGKSVPVTADPEAIDTCGTGGDHSNSINVSTIAALLAAGAGAVVAKHGNRSVSSACGSANVLEALGVNLDLGPEAMARCIREAGIGFMLAPKYHPAMRHVMPARQELGQRTLFNLMGPLLNPARVSRQVIGVPDLALTQPFAEVLRRLGSRHVMIVAGTDGFDEISLSAPTKVAELKDGVVKEYILNPQDLGFSLCSKADLQGGDAPRNAEILRGILSGSVRGPMRDISVLNAAAALYVAGKARDLRDGVKLAEDAIRTGAAERVLEKWIRVSHAVTEGDGNLPPDAQKAGA